MTLAARVDAFKSAFPDRPASWPWLVQEQGRDVVYAIWVLGQDYRNKSGYYGAYPPGFLDRVMAFFPDVRGDLHVLHAFSGSLPVSDGYTRLDVNPACSPDVVGSVYDAPALFRGGRFTLVVADPPYSAADAVHYDTAGIDRRRATAALAGVVGPGGHLAWLDQCWPMHNKREWLTVGRVLVQRSTNHRARVLSLFERAA